MLSRFLPILGLTALLACVAVVAPAAAGAPASGSSSLYDRLGGGTAIASLAGALVDEAASNPRTSRSWHKVTLSRVKGVLGEYLCSLTGGPCTYNGDSMKEIHAGLDITQSEMYAIVESLRTIMVAQGIALRERNELLALLAPAKRDIVTR